jgi:hypothetical protein
MKSAVVLARSIFNQINPSPSISEGQNFRQIGRIAAILVDGFQSILLELRRLWDFVDADTVWGDRAILLMENRLWLTPHFRNSLMENRYKDEGKSLDVIENKRSKSVTFYPSIDLIENKPDRRSPADFA